MNSVREKLVGKTVILASQSPRRCELLRNMAQLEFHVVKSTFAEDIDKMSCIDAVDYVKRTCEAKVINVGEKILGISDTPLKLAADLIISADTIVVLNGKILEKPKNAEEALSMIRSLSGKEHDVYTAVSLSKPQEACKAGFEVKTFFEHTKVTFLELPEETMQEYVKTDEPYDKAGGYGIQSVGGSFVSKYEGDFYNVVGLPLDRLVREIDTFL